MLLSDPVFQELNRRSVTEGRMLPLPVVEDLDVFEAGGLHVGMSGIANAMHPLVFEAVEPALRRRVIPAVPFPAHRAGHAECLELVLKGVAGVLAAAVGVMQQPRRRALPEPGHGQARRSRCPPSCAVSATNRRLHG